MRRYLFTYFEYTLTQFGTSNVENVKRPIWTQFLRFYITRVPGIVLTFLRLGSNNNVHVYKDPLFITFWSSDMSTDKNNGVFYRHILCDLIRGTYNCSCYSLDVFLFLFFFLTGRSPIASYFIKPTKLDYYTNAYTY